MNFKTTISNEIDVVKPFEIFEDPPLSNNWYFELYGKIYGAFDSQEIAQLAQSGMIDDASREEMKDDNSHNP